jgi:hypothetical protein
MTWRYRNLYDKLKTGFLANVKERGKDEPRARPPGRSAGKIYIDSATVRTGNRKSGDKKPPPRDHSWLLPHSLWDH